MLQMLYKNNLTNNFLYSVGKAASPMCPDCGREEHTADHILLRCTAVEVEHRKSVEDCLDLTHRVDNITLINASRKEDFIRTCLQIVVDVDLRSDIDLNEHYI